ncbi:uncharacterized protein SOCE836_099450 [Sorangium cellulosum]|uniref:Ketosynthase family 3 (KS3) domain-containing protein n=1 Tax=Sorangium cellulosum TaxID=56 RepID=A0A4P2R3Z3_SORCE|nr:type I polyketide synthase [Sorangium cellulosum]AUX37715.1 uncharacterized protein SOCE836_099450 [Sorangium cellulosum]
MTTPSSSEPRAGLELAIVGMAGRFPGARDVATFWQNLCAGVESVAILTDEELLAAGVDPALIARPDYVRARAVLDDIDLFDAELFGFTPREAAALDPQHRLFLECAWEAFENAGIDPERAGGPVGVYAGSSLSGYLTHLFPGGPRLQSAADVAALLALDKDFLTTRVSYKLNLEGPSIAVQTACSTSLVAVHLACQGLLTGECDLALAGGASIGVPQKVGYLYQEGAIASPDGHCRAFDAGARGTVGGSGVGVVLLKRLDDAIADRDAIIAVIKGSAVNNDGRAKVGYTAPRIEGQARVIRAAHAAAGVDAGSIDYVEAHGTGTPLGDPIEIAALTRAFRATTDRKGFCAIGSAKTNVGHLDAAAGVAGLIKAALAVAHGRIPPSLHFRAANPALDLENSPFYVAAELAAWTPEGAPRRAGVSAFGLGGTNAHVVLEQAPPPPETDPPRPCELLVLSARSSASLERLTDALAEHLEAHAELALGDVAHTQQLGRRAFAHRRAVVCRSREEAALSLRDRGGALRTGGPVAGPRPVAFLFPGQGAHRPNMGRDLYETEPVFRAEVDACASRLERHLGLDIRALLFPAHAELEDAARRLDRTSMTQPALFVVEYALARLWMAWGLTPDAMLGHSVGEVVAACVAGCLSLDDALALVAARGRLMEATPEGAMLAVSASEAEVAGWLGEEVALAAVNGPRQCVLSGRTAAIQQVEREAAGRGVEARRLRVSRAFHSHLMEGALDGFREAVGRVTLRAPRIPWVSNVTGTWITEAEAQDPGYWVRHLRSTVRFAGGVTALREQPERIFLEVGPGQTLTALCRQVAAESLALASLPAVREAGAGARGARGARRCSTRSGSSGWPALRWTGQACKRDGAGGASRCRQPRSSGSGTGWSARRRPGRPQPRSGPPQPRSGPPQPRSGPPQPRSGPPQPRSGPPQPRSGPPRSAQPRSARRLPQHLAWVDFSTSPRGSAPRWSRSRPGTTGHTGSSSRTRRRSPPGSWNASSAPAGGSPTSGAASASRARRSASSRFARISPKTTPRWPGSSARTPGRPRGSSTPSASTARARRTSAPARSRMRSAEAR